MEPRPEPVAGHVWVGLNRSTEEVGIRELLSGLPCTTLVPTQ